MKKYLKINNVKGFTLVELLAVIVILAIILVIAVPKVMTVIEDSKKATLESTAKLIASSAEKAKVQNTVLGKDETITCDSVAKINDLDYEDCDIDFDENTAKVTIKGKGKFNGLWVCNGTKTSAISSNESCGLIVLKIDANGGNLNTTYKEKYEAGSEVTLTEPTKEGYAFDGWIVTGTGASVKHNILTVGTEETKVTASWRELTQFEKDNWETIVAAVQQAEKNRIEYPYNVGDAKIIDLGTTLGKHTIRVANKTKCNALQTEPISKTACGFVLEFADVIEFHAMNSINEETSTNVGGWPTSEMRTYVNSTIYNALPEKLKEGVIDTYVVSSHGTKDEGTIGENKNFESTDKLYLLSTEEVWTQGSGNTIDNDTSRGTSRQLDYYATYKGTNYTGVSTTNYEGAIKKSESAVTTWWLRSSLSSQGVSFYYTGINGDWDYTYSYINRGSSPAFRLAN